MATLTVSIDNPTPNQFLTGDSVTVSGKVRFIPGPPPLSITTFFPVAVSFHVDGADIFMGGLPPIQTAIGVLR